MIGLGDITVFSCDVIYFSYHYSQYSDEKDCDIFCACVFMLTCVLSVIFSNMAAVGEQLTEMNGTKSPVLNYFGLLTYENGRGVEPDSPVCKICHTQVRAKSGNTSNLLSHLKNKHMCVYKELKAKIEDEEREECASKTKKERNVLQRPRLRTSQCWGVWSETSHMKEIVNDGVNWQTLLLVGLLKTGYHCTWLKSRFKKMLAEFDVMYTIPIRNYFSRTATPNLYASTQKIVCQEIWAAEYFSATTDMWSSVGMKPYLSFVSSSIDLNLRRKCLIAVSTSTCIECMPHVWCDIITIVVQCCV